MAPEYGATCGIFPVDAETLRYLRLHRPRRRADRAGRGVRARSRGCSTPRRRPRPSYTDTLELDLATVEPSLAGPKRPQDRVPLTRRARRRSTQALPDAADRRSQEGAAAASASRTAHAAAPTSQRRRRGTSSTHGSVVIAAITSCTNTSNPSVMIAAGLLAKKAVERGLHGQAVGEDQPRAGLEGRDRLPAATPGCCRTSRSSASTWSATAARPASATPGRCRPTSRKAIDEDDLVVAAVLSRQPQLRGPHQPGGARELPRVAAAGRRLRAGRHAWTSTSTPSRSARTRTASRST